MTPQEQLAASRRMHWMNLLEMHATDRGDVEALVGTDRRLTWSQVRDQVRAIAAELQRRGVAPGDRVFVLSLNSVQYVVALAAINTAGAIAVPLNIRSVGAELDYLIEDSGAVFGFADEMGAARLADATTAREVPVMRFGDEFEASAASGAASDPLDVAETETAFIVYTSGTTSAPKGAMLTHLNVLSQVITTSRMGPAGSAEDTAMIVVPLFHIVALSGMVTAFFNAVKAVIAPPRVLTNMAALTDMVEAEAVTSMFLVPTLWQAFCSQPGIRERRLGLKTLSWGASPATRETLQLMADTFPEAVISAGLGQTEMSPTTTVITGEESLTKMGSVGRPVSMVSARIVDPEGRDVAPGETGEIVYRGPGLMAGYWNKPERTDEATFDGWFHSGDLVRQDEDGFVYVVDRAKDIIISGGENISSVEVEHAVAAHPKVADASVVGVPHPTWVETPLAIVAPADPADPPTLEELRDFLSGRLASFKLPTRLEVMAELPRNASGKLQKHLLREEFGG
ncbi:AMP-binding protein [Brevibacterium album]|uniref:AMP-binding protein n=1 Tax=Brevibacterium album TaxID=417948 RepID=UPI00048D3399|nr:AMP-binding protein [Brevibacterium album]